MKGDIRLMERRHPATHHASGAHPLYATAPRTTATMYCRRIKEEDENALVKKCDELDVGLMANKLLFLGSFDFLSPPLKSMNFFYVSMPV